MPLAVNQRCGVGIPVSGLINQFVKEGSHDLLMVNGESEFYSLFESVTIHQVVKRWSCNAK